MNTEPQIAERDNLPRTFITEYLLYSKLIKREPMSIPAEVDKFLYPYRRTPNWH